MTDEPRTAATWRLVIGGMPERSMAEGMKLVLFGDGSDVPPFLTFAIEAALAPTPPPAPEP
jgi:hypothetical protein